jgi:hypothetical protein
LPYIDQLIIDGALEREGIVFVDGRLADGLLKNLL